MIFISYCWHDADLVRPYAQTLESLGHELWIDYKRLELSFEIEPQLASAIRQAQQVQSGSTYRRAKTKEFIEDAVETVAKMKGMTAETSEAIKRQILGVVN